MAVHTERKQRHALFPLGGQYALRLVHERVPCVRRLELRACRRPGVEVQDEVEDHLVHPCGRTLVSL